MTTENSQTSTHISVFNRIHKVEGFDPSDYVVPYTDLGAGETRYRLPVMIQIGWFRLAYPEGKISVDVSPSNDCFVAKARVYPSYKDPVDCYLGEATASRSYDVSKPSISPREWAQTAAVGIALRNAGFGLQFGAAGDEFQTKAPDELGVILDPLPGQEGGNINHYDVSGTAEIPAAAPVQQPQKILTPEEQFKQAASMLWPTKKYAGRTLGDVMNMDASAISWLANKYDANSDVSKAAKFMCEYAISQATG